MAWVTAGMKMINKLTFRFGLRAKLLLLSSFLFAIPWFGYQYVWEMEKYLRFGQEQTIIGTARALATALHERPNLFNNQASFLPSVEKGKTYTVISYHKLLTLMDYHMIGQIFRQKRITMELKIS